MRGRMAGAAIIAIAVAACGAAEPVSTVPEGSTAVDGVESAPRFSASTFDGGRFSLTDHLAEDGRPVFLNLWASWCLPCREEMPVIDDAAVRHPGVRFVGVAVQDGQSDAAAFADEIGVDYLLAFDDREEVDDGYLPLGLPASYIISRDGFLLEEVYGQLTADLIDQKLTGWFGG